MALLPNQGLDVEDVLRAFSPTAWPELQKVMAKKRGLVRLPRLDACTLARTVAPPSHHRRTTVAPRPWHRHRPAPSVLVETDKSVSSPLACVCPDYTASFVSLHAKDMLGATGMGAIFGASVAFDKALTSEAVAATGDLMRVTAVIQRVVIKLDETTAKGQAAPQGTPGFRGQFGGYKSPDFNAEVRRDDPMCPPHQCLPPSLYPRPLCEPYHRYARYSRLARLDTAPTPPTHRRRLSHRHRMGRPAPRYPTMTRRWSSSSSSTGACCLPRATVRGTCRCRELNTMCVAWRCRCRCCCCCALGRPFAFAIVDKLEARAVVMGEVQKPGQPGRDPGTCAHTTRTARPAVVAVQ